MRLIATCFGLLCAAWAGQAPAIVNIEDMRVEKPEEGFGGHVNLSLSGKSGNSDKQEITLGTRFQWQRNEATDFIVFSYEYGESNDVRDTNKTFAHARHIQHFLPMIAWEAFVQAEQNEFARLSFRGLAGGGLRYTLSEDIPRLGAYFGLGAFWVRETLEEDPSYTDHGSDNYIRASLYLSYKHRLTEDVHLVSTTYYQPRPGATGDYRALEQAALVVELTERLDLNLSLDITYDSEPPQGINHTDISYSSGIMYEF